jgi:hypothetical protein
VLAVNGEWLAERLHSATLTVDPGAGHGDTTFGAGDQLFTVLKQE